MKLVCQAEYRNEVGISKRGGTVYAIIEYRFEFANPSDDFLDWIHERRKQFTAYEVKLERYFESHVHLSTEDADLATLLKLTWGGAA